MSLAHLLRVAFHSNLTYVDWAIMVVAVVSLRLVSLSTRRYMRGVSDFLSANRVAGRYLLTIASQMGGTGVVSFVAMFEMYYATGLAAGWWSTMLVPAYTIIALAGWVYYRFRETRAMTMAQFLEMRYSRRLRIFAGILCWTSGIINFGIFPAVAARFFIYFCGIPDHFHIPGIGFPIPTIAPIMLVDLGLALSFVNMGGQISVMVTECVQGMFCAFAFIVVSATILIKVHWSQMVAAMEMGCPGVGSHFWPGSFCHPFSKLFCRRRDQRRRAIRLLARGCANGLPSSVGWNRAGNFSAPLREA